MNAPTRMRLRAKTLASFRTSAFPRHLMQITQTFPQKIATAICAMNQRGALTSKVAPIRRAIAEITIRLIAAKKYCFSQEVVIVHSWMWADLMTHAHKKAKSPQVCSTAERIYCRQQKAWMAPMRLFKIVNLKKVAFQEQSRHWMKTRASQGFLLSLLALL